MICLDDTDVIEGGAATDAVVEYTIHGLVGTTFTQLAAGVMNTTLTTALYTAGAAISVVSIILVNTHASAVAVTLRLDPADGGNPRYIIPKTVSLGAGYSLHTDGARITVMDASGNIQTLPGLHGALHKAGASDELLNDPGAIGGATPAAGAFTTINLTGGQIAFPAEAVPSDDPNTLDDCERGDWTPSVGGNATYIKQEGKYVKIGKLVKCSSDMSINVLGTGSTTIISGLPFTSLDADPISSGSVSYFGSLAVNVIFISLYVDSNSTSISFVSAVAATVSVTSLPAILGNAARIILSVLYEAKI